MFIRELPVLLSIVCVSVAVAETPSAVWPQLHGPQADNRAEASGLPVTIDETTNVTWKTKIPGVGWSSPVVWGTQVWMGTASEDGTKMFGICVDVETGRIVHELPLFTNEEVRFKHSMNSYASPTPVIEEGTVYLHFGSYGTAAIATETGEVRWSRRDLECDHFRGPGSSPVLFENLLILHYDGFDHQYIIALDKTTGETVWRKDRTIDYGTKNGDFKKAYNTPTLLTIDGEQQLISSTSKATIAYDPATGDELWRITYRGFSSTARPLLAGPLLLVNTGFSKAELHAVRIDGLADATGSQNVSDSHVEWVLKKTVPSKPTPVVVDDALYMVHDAGVLSCVDAATGEYRWQERLGGKYSASPLYADGKIYLLSHEGKVTVIEPGPKYRELSSTKLGDGFMASPAVVTFPERDASTMFLRSKSHLYRVETSSADK